ncbi:hypothetical protein B5X24_HaOG217203 [Helicoverpa armigera]|uniref:Endosome-associated-trafficking regulator 1 n=1 Tax=Helicoverpa armigera TaxID=29058 RepID=A0A2W1BYL9_HELAM|nr:uncharacterized protein LOC110375499 [Helicoverpa armigera]PZC78745.1 hypothetical protein B5X24_HaOG217203 [Helicoverpa armigera]
MAEDEDGVSNKKSPQNTNNEEPLQENEQNAAKPDLGIEEAKYNSNENGDATLTEAKSSSSKSTGATRKDENPFSFRHFLKRDLSLPGNSTYENTGARPKVYANTVQHSPTKIDVHADPRRDKPRATDSQAKDKPSDGSSHRISDNTSSSSSVEIPFSVVDNSDSKHNFYTDNNDVPFYHRPNLASEPLGMPSLPDFVQDHILVEQAYLNFNGPISVDLDNLPDFTFNTSFNAGSSSSLGRRNNSNYGGRGYNYEEYMGAASTSNEAGQAGSGMPLDLPAGAEAAGPVPLDLPPHLSLDLTESVNPVDRRNVSPRNTFPLDLPPNAGAESMCLPDFLPVHPGRTSPEPEHQDEQMQQILAELERTRCELFTERSRRSRLEEELTSSRAAAAALRADLSAARAAVSSARRSDREFAGQMDVAADRVENSLADAKTRAAEAESTIARLKNQIKKLKEELSASQEQVRSLRGVQGAAAAGLRRATVVAESSLRELLSGLEQLKTLSTNLDPT